MEINETLVCPKCKNKNFTIKREATYLYSYKFSTKDAVSAEHETKELPFLFDNREKTEFKEFIECDNCGARFPVVLEECNKNINFTILQKAIRSDYVDQPEFLG